MHIKKLPTAIAAMAFFQLFSLSANAQDIYISGHEFSLDGSSQNFTAKVWKNGTAQNLTNGMNEAVAFSLTIDNGDVYAAGYEYDAAHSNAKVWKNGTAQSLTDGTNESIAHSVTVYNDDVYVSGYENNGTHYVAKYWKNGVAHDLTDGSAHNMGTGIFVDNGDVYVTGFERIDPFHKIVKVWKNETLESTITDGSLDANAQSIYVYNGDIYVAGQEGGNAKLWKNGVDQNLSIDTTKLSDTYSVFVDTNGDVYVAGAETNSNGKYVATIWKNDVQQQLSDGTTNAFAYSVIVANNDVYTTGFTYDATGVFSTAKLWKNGTEEDITDGNSIAFAYSVVVDPDSLDNPEFETPENAFNSYPNPVKNLLYIDTNTAKSFQLYDVQGKLIKSFETEQNTSIDMSALPSGVYFLKDANGNSKKIIKK